MSDLKTRKNDASVTDFLNSIEDEKKKADCFVLLKVFETTTGEKAMMRGDSIIGFGEYHYVGSGGREGDRMITGFSPRKQAISLYMMCDLSKHKDILTRLGTFKTGKSCVYVKRREDINLNVLKELIERTHAEVKRLYG